MGIAKSTKTKSCPKSGERALFAGEECFPDIANDWQSNAIANESTLHQIAPYIGKMKPAMARSLINAFTQVGETVYDPFCGSGTIALEAWLAERQVVANDMSPYAVTITRAKLFHPGAIDEIFSEIEELSNQVKDLNCEVDLRKIPKWIRVFFHPDTLKEVISWSRVLKSRRSYFLLACLLGILHHQRPGFLSYPSSHTVPYLRSRKFPKENYPELYEYRSVKERLINKSLRVMSRIPTPGMQMSRKCYMRNAASLLPRIGVDAIITSPPYMRRLDYGRDNRLRLWFVGLEDWKALDNTVSPKEADFLLLFKNCLTLWRNALVPRGLCILVLGDSHTRSYGKSLPDAIADLATDEIGGYSVICRYTESIPDERRVRRNYRGNLEETILVLRNETGG